MARWIAFKEALVLALKSWRLWLLQLFGNTVIFLGFLWWLHISEAHWWNVLFSFVLIVVLFVSALAVHGGTLRYFQLAHEDKAAKPWPAFSSALRHLLALAVCVLVLHVLEHLVSEMGSYEQTFPGYLRSEFPAWLRGMISENRLDRLYTDLVWLLRWMVVPGLLLPFALSAAGRGFRGLIAFGDWRRTVGRIIYWITLLVASLIGVYCVSEIMHWKLNPETATLQGDTTSLIFRFLFVILLGIFAWLLTCSMLGRLRKTGQSGSQPQ
jgi:hypothetical protein